MPSLYSLCTHIMKLYRGYPDLSITHHWLFGKSESRHREKASPEDNPTSPQQNLQVQADSHIRASDSHTGLQKAMGRARPSPGRISRQVSESSWGCNPGDRELGSPGEHEDIKEGHLSTSIHRNNPYLNPMRDLGKTLKLHPPGVSTLFHRRRF